MSWINAHLQVISAAFTGVALFATVVAMIFVYRSLRLLNRTKAMWETLVSHWEAYETDYNGE